MVSAFTTNKRIEQPAFDDFIDAWQIPVNGNWSIIDKALGGVSTINLTGLSGVRVLTTAEHQTLKIRLTGTPAGNVTVTVPSPVGGLWVVQNDASGSFVESVASAAAPAILVAAPQGSRTLMTCDGSASGMSLAINSPPAAAGSATQVQYHGPGGVLTGSANLTWNNASATLGTSGLTASGNTTLGSTSGNVLTVPGQHVQALNGLRFNSDQLYLTNPSTGIQVGIGTTIVDPSARLTVSGNIKVTGGYTFSDGTTQTTAATGGGGGGTAAGSTTQVQYNSGGAFGASSSFTFNGTTLSVPNLALTTALPVAEGGTGVTTSTGTGAGVHANSPALSGTPTAPTAGASTNTTQIATTAFVQSAITASNAATTASLTSDIVLSTPGTITVGPLTAPPANATVVYASGTVTLFDTGGTAQFIVQLWDGVTIIASAAAWAEGGHTVAVALSGLLTNAVGNSIFISVTPLTSPNGRILASLSGHPKLSTVTALKVA